MLYFWHSVGNAVLTTFSNMLTNLNLTDMETCYKAIRGEVARGLTLTSDRFGFEPEVTAQLAKRRARIFEVPISYSGRTYAEGKKIGWKDGFRAIYCILKYNLFRRPAKKFEAPAQHQQSSPVGCCSAKRVVNGSSSEGH